MVDAPTDERLLADHVAGDGGSFAELVRRHNRELFQFVLRFTSSSAAAEDVAQEAFLQVHLSASSFDQARRFKPWLFTIAANKARDWLRSRARKSEVPLDARIGSDDGAGQTFADLLADEELPVDQGLQNQEKRQAVQRVMDELPGHLREALVLSYYHRFAYKEMAAILDIPLGTVKSRLHSAVAQFGRQYKAAVEAGLVEGDPLTQGLEEET